MSWFCSASWPTLGEWLQAAPALATAAIAWLVHQSGRRQAAFNEQLAVRTAAIDEQTLRLALLERRAAVIAKLRAINDRLTSGPDDQTALVRDAEQLVSEAELIFDGKIRQQLKEIASNFVKWNAIGRRVIRLEKDQLGEEVRDTNLLLSEIEMKMVSQLDELPNALVAAAAIEPLPLLPPRPA